MLGGREGVGFGSCFGLGRLGAKFLHSVVRFKC